MSDKISIIIPIYNSERTLRRCINSVIRQTYDNVEILLIDDGSTDSSAAICDSYKKMDERIRVIHKKNGGVSDARNVGVSNASGIYISFVDSDDFVEPTYIEQLYNISKEQHCDLSVCNYIDDSNNTKQENTVTVYRDLDEKINSLITNKNIENYLWNKLFIAKLFKGIVFQQYTVMEDYDIMYKLFEKANGVAVTDQILYHYTQREASLTHQVDSNIVIDSIKIRNKRYIYLSRRISNSRIIRADYYNNFIQLLFLSLRKKYSAVIEYVNSNKKSLHFSRSDSVFKYLSIKNRVKYIYCAVLLKVKSRG